MHHWGCLIYIRQPLCSQSCGPASPDLHYFKQAMADQDSLLPSDLRREPGFLSNLARARPWAGEIYRSEAPRPPRRRSSHSAMGRWQFSGPGCSHRKQKRGKHSSGQKKCSFGSFPQLTHGGCLNFPWLGLSVSSLSPVFERAREGLVGWLRGWRCLCQTRRPK